MTQLEVVDKYLIIKVQGADKIWALKSQLSIALEHIDDVGYDPDLVRNWYRGLKVIGSRIPGVLMAGTFIQDGQRVFWDVYDPEQAIVISLQDENYQQLIIEVEDPQTQVARLQALI